jgi:hypothetical protein
MTMTVTRRVLLSGTVAGALTVRSRIAGQAQVGTPNAVDAGTPVAAAPVSLGYAIARLRVLPAELQQAIYPHVMHRFLPAAEAVPGFAGYIISFSDDDPGTAITLTLTADEAAAEAEKVVSEEFVAGLDPRLAAVETPVAEQGPIIYYGATTRPATELSPFYHGYRLTMRVFEMVPGWDQESADALAEETLLPEIMGMEGFIFYGWVHQENVALGFNIWETDEEMAAGDAAVGDWVAENNAGAGVGPPAVYAGSVGYAFIPGLV